MALCVSVCRYVCENNFSVCRFWRYRMYSRRDCTSRHTHSHAHLALKSQKLYGFTIESKVAMLTHCWWRWKHFARSTNFSIALKWSVWKIFYQVHKWLMRVFGVEMQAFVLLLCYAKCILCIFLLWLCVFATPPSSLHHTPSTVTAAATALLYSSVTFSRSSLPSFLFPVFSHFLFLTRLIFFSARSLACSFARFFISWSSTVQFVDSFLRPAELECIQFALAIAVKFSVFICLVAMCERKPYIFHTCMERIWERNERKREN